MAGGVRLARGVPGVTDWYVVRGTGTPLDGRRYCIPAAAGVTYHARPVRRGGGVVLERTGLVEIAPDGTIAELWAPPGWRPEEETMTTRTDKGIHLRLPPDLRERVDRAAAEEAARRGRPLTVQQWIRELLEWQLARTDDHG